MEQELLLNHRYHHGLCHPSLREWKGKAREFSSNRCCLHLHDLSHPCHLCHLACRMRDRELVQRTHCLLNLVQASCLSHCCPMFLVSVMVPHWKVLESGWELVWILLYLRFLHQRFGKVMELDLGYPCQNLELVPVHTHLCRLLRMVLVLRSSVWGLPLLVLE